MFKDETLGTIWVGEVIQTDDPLFLGRVKIKVFGKFDELDPEVIPWALPYNQLASGTVIIPKIGEYCNVFFENGDEYVPFYSGIAKTNDGLLGEFGEDYPKVWSIVYDKRMGEDGTGEAGDERTLEIFYTETQGLMIRKNESFIQIKNEDESIILSNGSTSKVVHISDDGISLGTEGTSAEPAVLADTLEQLLIDFLGKLELVQVTSPAGPCSPLSASPQWAQIKSSFMQKDSGWKDFKSLLVTLDKEKE
jgi:hypothetical protein